MRFRSMAPALVGILAATLLVSTTAGARGPRPAGSCGDPLGRVDFNGDDRPDLAIGAPFATVNGKARAGAVLIVYGGATALVTAGSTVITQATAGVTDAPETDDRFGTSLAAADFDCDGDTDLAVGVPFEDVDGVADLGLVNFLSGSPGGLVGDGRSWTLTDSVGQVDAGSEIGAALVTLDSMKPSGPGADGRPDLAVGSPGEARFPGGFVIVLHGSFVDPTAGSGGTQLITPDVSDGARAGAALAAGDLDDIAADELIIGAPRADAGAIGSAGAIAELSNGLSEAVVLAPGGLLTLNPVAGDRLGAAVAVGDLDGDGYAEVAAGIPGRDAGATDAGAVLIIPSTAGGDGLDLDEALLVRQGAVGVPWTPEVGDRFGAALSIGSLGRGERLDLAVGVPGDRVGGADGAGSVVVLYGAASLIATTGNQRWTQASSGIADDPQAGDELGATVVVADRGRGAPADLVVGAPKEDLGGTADAGAVHVLYATDDGVGSANDRLLTRDSADSGTIAGKARLGAAAR